jgi:hypothetical protein
MAVAALWSLLAGPTVLRARHLPKVGGFDAVLHAADLVDVEIGVVSAGEDDERRDVGPGPTCHLLVYATLCPVAAHDQAPVVTAGAALKKVGPEGFFGEVLRKALDVGKHAGTLPRAHGPAGIPDSPAASVAALIRAGCGFATLTRGLTVGVSFPRMELGKIFCGMPMDPVWSAAMYRWAASRPLRGEPSGRIAMTTTSQSGIRQPVEGIEGPGRYAQRAVAYQRRRAGRQPQRRGDGGRERPPADRWAVATWTLTRQDGRWLIAAYHNCPA